MPEGVERAKGAVPAELPLDVVTGEQFGKDRLALFVNCVED